MKYIIIGGAGVFALHTIRKILALKSTTKLIRKSSFLKLNYIKSILLFSGSSTKHLKRSQYIFVFFIEREFKWFISILHFVSFSTFKYSL